MNIRSCDCILLTKSWSLVFNQTEYMVDMKCEGCVDAVKQKLQTVTGRQFAASIY